MNIIAQSGAIVNIYVSSNQKTAAKKARAAAKRKKRQEEGKQDYFARWQNHKIDAVAMAQRLALLGFTSRAERMLMCGNELSFTRCNDCGKIHIAHAELCRDRLCPICNWRLSIQRYAAMQRILSKIMDKFPKINYSLCTLTVENCKGKDLYDHMSTMQNAWHWCMCQRWMKSEVIGWARSIECTYSTHDEGSLHPHYHVLLTTADKVSGNKLIDEWLRQCQKHGIRAVRDAQHIDNIQSKDTPGDSLAGAVCEVYKYAVKSSDLLSMPLEALRELAVGMKGKRLISFGGEIKRIAKELELDDIDAETDEDQQAGITLCKDCGSQAIDEIALRWSLSSNRYIASVSTDAAAADTVQAIIDKAIAVRDKIN